MTSSDETRPPLAPGLSGAELQRWYWTRRELEDLARSLGARTSGGKLALTARLAAVLDGREHVEDHAPRRATSAAQLTGPLTCATVVPAGQRCSQVLRAWFVEQLGPAFRFDGEMRAFVAAADGTTTLGDALEHWRRTRDAGRGPIDPQFEHNRFTRSWRDAHPDGAADDLRAAWWAHRSLPVEARGPV